MILSLSGLFFIRFIFRPEKCDGFLADEFAGGGAEPHSAEVLQHLPGSPFIPWRSEHRIEIGPPSIIDSEPIGRKQEMKNEFPIL